VIAGALTVRSGLHCVFRALHCVSGPMGGGGCNTAGPERMPGARATETWSPSILLGPGAASGIPFEEGRERQRTRRASGRAEDCCVRVLCNEFLGAQPGDNNYNAVEQQMDADVGSADGVSYSRYA
jgi:hypothetical protein